MTRFSRFAWGVTAYNILVILWGAWVRISGSGAGCGEHWPDCNGEVIPTAPTTRTLIEFTHRATSGLCLVLTLAMAVWAYRVFAPRHHVRRAANVTLAFVLAEAALGALWVIFGLVEKNDSVARAIVVGVHLVNTFGLVGAGALTAYWASGGPLPSRSHPRRNVFGVAIVAVLLVGMTGAITALGDTLFPVSPTDGAGLLAHIRADLSAGEHFLVRLRIVHPLVALLAGGFLVTLAFSTLDDAPRASWTVIILVTAQMIAGTTNVALAAPGWMQIIHLLLADVLWIALLIQAVECLADREMSC